MQYSYAADTLTESRQGTETIPYPKPTSDKADDALVKKGEYLAKAGDCIACHTDTKNQGKPFAGGLGLDTPFGTFYSPNITPDIETGIGNWSDKDFLRALHKGKNPKGQHFFPVFPYTSYTKVSDEDLLAIKAYLLSIPPVHAPAKENDVAWPFSMRFLQLGWKILFFKSGQVPEDPNRSAQWNRGRYLVDGLGHCGECHTPRNKFGGMKKKYYLTGAFIDGFFAPDITSYGIGDESEDAVVKVFTEGEKLHGAGKVRGPMEEVEHNSLVYLSNDDLHAMAGYLKTVKGVQHKKVKERDAAEVTSHEAKKIYNKHCAVCHDSGAAGAPKMFDHDAWTELSKQGIQTLLHNAVNGLNSMPARGTCMTCSEGELEAVIEYIIDLSTHHGSEDMPRGQGKKPPKLTIAAGKTIYENNCTVCHASGALGAPKVGDRAAWTPLIKQNMDVLFQRTIQGYGRHPVRGACVACSDEELIAAVKYMAGQSVEGSDYSLW